MNLVLLILSMILIVFGAIYFVAFWKNYTDSFFGASIIVLGIVAFVLSITNPSKESLYKLTVTDTVTNKKEVYEFVTDIEEHESYIKFTDKDGNEQYLMMEDKEILKEELE